MVETTIHELWQKACHILQKNMSPSSYTTWIMSSPLTDFRVVGNDRAVGVITSPTAFHSTNVEKNFYAQIKEVLDDVSGLNSELQFRIGEPTVSKDKVVSLGIDQVQGTNFSVIDNPSEADSVTPPFVYEQPPSPTTNQISEESASPNKTYDEIAPSPITVVSTERPLTGNISSVQEKLRHLATQEVRLPGSPNTPSPFRYVASSPSHNSSEMNSADLFSQTSMQSVSVDRARLQAQRAGLRPDFTFDTFAVSTTNEMAHAAALAVSNQPGTAYNPLFIYGGVGVGKTHLMQAVGNNILKNNPDVKILYCTGEDFTNEIVNAIQNKKALLFKEKFRTVDVLLIDDVQFIAGKNTVQEEFFHTFNSITKRSGQIILTSDQPPHDIALLEDRLRSRFEAGLMVDIQQPSFELRTAILLIKANAYRINIPMNLAQFIASKVDSARKIEGFMKSIKSEVELKHREVTPELINEIFRNEGEKNKQKLRMKPYDLIKTVADFYHIKIVTIRGPQRMKSIVRARHVAMYFLKEELNLPYVEIGRWFENRDHTSAMHALKKITQEIDQDEDLRQEISSIRNELVKISK
jgi:chromosomal replication initiator protein